MLFAIIMMNTFGVSGNLMSLGALDFGLIVDGAVIIVEAVLHHLVTSKKYAGLNSISQQQIDTEVESSASRMMNAAVFGQIIILIVYLPILSLQGIEGKMFKPMAQTVAFAILGAFLLSLTYVPMMSALFLSKKLSKKATISDRIMNRLERSYQGALARVLVYKKTVIAGALSLLAIAIILFSFMGGEFIPQLEEGDFAVETRLLTGSNLQNTINTTQKMSKILLDSFPEVEKIVTRVGSAEIPTDPMPLEGGDVVVILKDKKEWVSASSFTEMADKMAEKAAAIPGITTGFQFPVQMRFNEMMTGAKQDVICKIFGEDLDTLAAYAAKLGAISTTIEGTADLYVETVTGMPQVIIDYDRNEIAKYGLNIAEINRTVNAAFAGAAAGQVYEGEKRFDLVVRVGSEGRKSLEDIQNLLIATPEGSQIPLQQVADIKETEGPNQIQRENAQRRIIVGFNVRGRDVQSIVQEMQEKVDQQVKLPAGYYVTYGGAFENLQQAKKRLSIAVPVSLVLIFVMLYFAFRSVKEGILIYTAIPLSAIGGVIALWLRGMPFSISAGVGFIALFGVAVLNGIVLISEFNRLKKAGLTNTLDIVLEGTKNRLRPVLMTASVASLGFLPMALSNGAGAEVQRPLATVVIGGLVSATLLTLFVLPVLFVLFEKGFRRLKPVNKVVATSIILLLAPALIKAQSTIGLPAAIDSALRNNRSLQASRIGEQYYGALQRTYFDINPTGINVEYGKINSAANDNRISFSQSVAFPQVYKTQKSINNINFEISRTNTKIAGLDLKSEVKKIYYQLLILRQKQKLLAEADSIYAGFQTKTEQRFKLGDVDVIEFNTANNQRIQIGVQLQSLKTDYLNLLHQFRFLLNTTTLYEPNTENLLYRLTILPDSLSIQQNPLFVLQQQQVDLSINQKKFEQSKMLPLVNMGYNSQTIIGYQKIEVDEKYYGSDKRFSSVSLGIGIPVFRSAQRARIKAADFLITQRQRQLDLTQQKLWTDLSNAIRSYTRYNETLNIYESQLLINASSTIDALNKRLYRGEIGYLEWVILLNQSFELRSKYLEVVQSRNEAAIDVEKLSAQN